jgi:hypothetical protein
MTTKTINTIDPRITPAILSKIPSILFSTIYVEHALAAIFFILQTSQSQSFSPPLMGGVRGGWRKQLILMVSSTPAKFCKTSLFQNRMTLNPWLRSHASRRISWSFSSSACCPPSTSITRRLSKATKSTMYSPMGACLLNLVPSQFLPFR